VDKDILQDRPSEGIEVEMVDPEIVRQIRAFASLKWGTRRIARELGIARKTVKRYVRGGALAEVQTRPTARVLSEALRAEAVQLFESTAEGNAVVVADLLAERGVEVHPRTVQRAVRPHREAKRAAEVATVRFETAPGHQLQIDFGEKWVWIAETRTRVMLFVAVLGYSRREYVQAFLSQRHDDWREGLAGAFRHFGGITQTVLIDNAKALVLDRDPERKTARIHPAFDAFCRDWGVTARACQPYRARTKGKTERGVGYAKHNALAGRRFDSFADLEAHLARWMAKADERVHGTTHEPPRLRFDRDERAALRPLPANPLPVRQRRLARKVSSDCFVDVDTIRYSVPHRLVRRTVDVVVGDDVVVVFDGTEVVARHMRSSEPHQRVVDKSHFEGLCRVTTTDQVAAAEHPFARSLGDYVDVAGGAW
jgi:transposase